MNLRCIVGNQLENLQSKRVRLAVIASMFAFFYLSAQSAQPQSSPKFVSTPCADSSKYPDAKCGTVTVFENRTTKSGRTISLSVAVLPALNKEHQPDPLFMIAGGPGQPSAAFYIQGIRKDFVNAVRANRDVVLVDQRGTGGSHALPCVLYPASAGVQALFGEFANADIVRACRDTLSKDADLTQYTTPIAVDDLDDVRAALGYDEINLQGGSYGTRVALVYLRQHPTHVRSAILEGVAPTDYKLPLPVARASQHALDRVMDDCAEDAVCHKAFPDVRADLNTILANLEKSPAKIQVVNPATKKPEMMELTRNGFADRLGHLLYSPDSASLVPFLLNQGAHGNLGAFASVDASVLSQVEAGINRGMYLSVTCAEDVPWITDAELTKETAGTIMGVRRTEYARSACKEWPRAKISADYLKPVDSNAPVLILSGGADPVAPSWIADGAAKHLPNSRHIIIKYAAHTTSAPCLDGLMEKFLDAGSAKSLDDSCVNEIHRPVFFTQASVAEQFSEIPTTAKPSEVWEGALQAGGQKLRLVLRVYRVADGKVSAAMDSLDQEGAVNLRVNTVTIEKNHLHFEMKAVNVVYDGDISEDGGNAHGIWKQGAGSLPLDFHRSDEKGSDE
jgi:pimeloyl-ACP methyl ester carboxylesterase